MLNFWNLIVESNTFNFAILVVILVIVWQKADLSSKTEDLRKSIIDFMEKSMNEKSLALKKLYSAQNEVQNLDGRIEKELNEAVQRARNVASSIEDMTRVSIEKSEKNISTVIENEKRKISNTLLNDTIDKAVSRSEEILKEKFRNNPELHDEYIKRSLKILDKAEIK